MNVSDWNKLRPLSSHGLRFHPARSFLITPALVLVKQCGTQLSTIHLGPDGQLPYSKPPLSVGSPSLIANFQVFFSKGVPWCHGGLFPWSLRTSWTTVGFPRLIQLFLPDITIIPAAALWNAVPTHKQAKYSSYCTSTRVQYATYIC